MDWPKLKAEIETDPLGRAYAGMTDQQLADALNAVNRTRQKTHLASAQIYEATDVAEFQAKTNAQKEFVRDIWGLGDHVDIRAGSKARAVYVNVFGATSQTITNLQAAAAETVSRAVELNLGETPAAEHIARVRAWIGA